MHWRTLKPTFRLCLSSFLTWIIDSFSLVLVFWWYWCVVRTGSPTTLAYLNNRLYHKFPGKWWRKRLDSTDRKNLQTEQRICCNNFLSKTRPHTSAICCHTTWGGRFAGKVENGRERRKSNSQHIVILFSCPWYESNDLVCPVTPRQPVAKSGVDTWQSANQVTSHGHTFLTPLWLIFDFHMIHPVMDLW